MTATALHVAASHHPPTTPAPSRTYTDDEKEQLLVLMAAYTKKTASFPAVAGTGGKAKLAAALSSELLSTMRTSASMTRMRSRNHLHQNAELSSVSSLSSSSSSKLSSTLKTSLLSSLSSSGSASSSAAASSSKPRRSLVNSRSRSSRSNMLRKCASTPVIHFRMLPQPQNHNRRNTTANDRHDPANIMETKNKEEQEEGEGVPAILITKEEIVPEAETAGTGTTHIQNKNHKKNSTSTTTPARSRFASWRMGRNKTTPTPTTPASSSSSSLSSIDDEHHQIEPQEEQQNIIEERKDPEDKQPHLPPPDSSCCNSSAVTHHSTNSMVSFGSCEIRTYNQVVGDHPCCHEGMPIQLGWDYTDAPAAIAIDRYEDMKEFGPMCMGIYSHSSTSSHDDHDEDATVHREDPTQNHPIGVVHLPAASELDTSSNSMPLLTVTCCPSTAAATSSSSSSSYSLRLSPEERKEILIKQMVVPTPSSSTTTTAAAANSATTTNSPVTMTPTSPPSATAAEETTTTNTTGTTTLFRNERELIRECRRLNRYKDGQPNGSSSSRALWKKQQQFFATDETNALTLETNSLQNT